MNKFKWIFCIIILVCLMASIALAREVTLSLPADEELSSMALREKAMAKGFAMAVVSEAMTMLPGKLDAKRAELLQKYYTTHAKPYIQGYKILTSKISDQGVYIGLDVNVNRKNLRQGLKSMGLFTTSVSPVKASVAYPDDLDEQIMEILQGLVILTGVEPTEDGMPVFSLENGPEKTYKARLTTEDKEWLSIQKDLSVAWFNVWKRYFSHEASTGIKIGTKKLIVAGWFSPDAVLEFDRVLRGWESAVQEVQLVEMDMQSSGVGGTWDLRLLSSEKFDMLLKSYLPQRGLTYHLSEEGEE